jgi:hypothetical protein
MGVRAEGANRFGHPGHDIDEFGGFGRRDPRHVQSISFDPHVFHQVVENGKFPSGVVITFQVMAVTRMSPGHPNAVGAIAQGGQGEFGAHPAGTGDTDDADIGWVLHPADTGQIRGTITAPVAQKCYNFRFPFRHGFSPYVLACPAAGPPGGLRLNGIEHGKNLIVVKSAEMDGTGPA